MFRVTLKISQESGYAPVNRNRRRKCQLLLVTVSLFSVVGLFLLSCYGREPFLVDIGFNETANGTRVLNRASKILGRMGTSNDSFKGSAASKYCSIKDCNMIRCSSIPAQLDPGEIASKFIKTDFKIDCGTIKSITLNFENCKFPSNIIRKNWLRIDLIIDSLILSNSFLTDIEDDAFLPAHFSAMKGLIIISNNIHSLRKAVFKNLPNLRFLTIRDNMVQYVDFDLMANQARTLENLELEGVFGDSKGLENITGATTLAELQLLSLRRNILPEVDENMFSGVSKVKSLFLDGSEITNIHPKAFNPMSKSIIMLIISNNTLTSLPEGLFDSIVNWNCNFRVSIEINPFHCDCSLKWLQDFIRDYPLIVRAIPKCSSPKSYQGLLLTRANFCQDNTSNTITSPTDSITTIPKTTESSTTAKTVHILCNSYQSILMESPKSRRLLWSADFELAIRYPGFTISETERGDVLVKLPNITKDLALVWFESDDPDDTLNCEKNVRTSFLIRHTRHDTSYTVCLLQKNENSISPLNCLAITTNSDYDSSVWLTNADKSTVFYSTFGSLFILCPCIAALTFVIVRRHPSLLKGSKRVMLVKRRNVEAIVLPKGVTIQSESRKIDRELSVSSSQDDGYVIPLPPSPLPLPPRRSVESLLNKDSGVPDWSSQSDGRTYVSVVEPTMPQMVSWELKRLKSCIEQNKPPLPPREVPSISSGIQSKENIYSENLFYSV